MTDRAWVVAALALLTALGFFVFPGHTWLQSDTQIYVPILERLWDRSVFEEEIIAQKPHVAFTMYDEAALGLRRITGWSFREVLTLQQVVFRFAGLAGVFLIAYSFGVGSGASLVVTAVYGLGATIIGPSVLTFEYEPVPRGNAIGLTLLAMGLVANERYIGAGFAAGLAFLYHVPAVYPYWAAYFLLALIPGKPERMRQRVYGLLPMAGAVLLLFVLSQLQVGGEKQQFFTRIDAEHEAMMRERASYNWVSLWSSRFYWHWLTWWAVGLVGMWRLRKSIPRDLRVLLAGVMAIGMMSMPLSYILLERMKWSIVPQIQPMRSVLYVMAGAILLAGVAAVKAASERRWLEGAGWFFAALAPATQNRTVQWLWDPQYAKPLLVLAGMAVVLTAAMRFRGRARVVLIAAALAPYLLIPQAAGVRNYPALHHRELDELIGWAKANTARDAVFLFPDAGKSLHPGVFRAESLRTVYADWKGGGQINFLREFLTEWLPRWQKTMVPPFDPLHIERYRQYGVDYIAIERKWKVPDITPSYQNGRYAVYRIP